MDSERNGSAGQPPASLKAEVEVAGEPGSWSSNTLRFATAAEASDYGKDLARRWKQVVATRVAQSDDSVTHQFAYSKLVRVAAVAP